MKKGFKIQLKDEESQGATLAFIIGLNKAFKNYRFVWSTGIKVKAKGFDPARPGTALKRLLKVADSAYDSLIQAGQPVNNDTLKSRIELLRDRIAWNGNELHIWDGATVQYFSIPEGVDREALHSKLQKELTKQRPDFKRIIEATLTDGQNELFGFWSGILDGKIKPRHGKPLRQSSVYMKRQVFRLVKEFDPRASFEKMDMAWYNGFVRWMEVQTVKVTLPDDKFEFRKRFDTNTIGKHIRQLKAVLHLAYRNELIQHDRFKYWPVAKESNEVVTLSKEDLMKINSLDLTGAKLEAKDIFVIACFLGPRISDFKTLRKESLVTNAGITFFEYVQEKTGARVKIPVHPIVQEILDKRGGDTDDLRAELPAIPEGDLRGRGIG